MGFFQDLKQDLSQAVNELMPEDAVKEAEVIDTEDDTTMDDTLRDVEAALSKDFDLDDGIVEGSEMVEKSTTYATRVVVPEPKTEQEDETIGAAAVDLAGIINMVAREEVEKANEVSEPKEQEEEIAQEMEDDLSEETEGFSGGFSEGIVSEVRTEPAKKPVPDNVVAPPQWQSWMRERRKAEEKQAEEAELEAAVAAEQEADRTVDEAAGEAEEQEKAAEKRPVMMFRRPQSVALSQRVKEREEEKREAQRRAEQAAAEAELAQQQAKEAAEAENPAVAEETVAEQPSEDRAIASPQEMLESIAKPVSAPAEETVSRISVKKQAAKTMNLADESPVDETAVITAGMAITGDVLSKGNMDILGTVNGNIEILGKLNIEGKVIGDSKAADIVAQSANITGKIIADGSVQIGLNCVVIGDIQATSAVIAGAVKGNLDVMGPVILDNSAVVMGNIKSKSVQISSGAIVEGMCSQCYADVKAEAFFE